VVTGENDNRDLTANILHKTTCDIGNTRIRSTVNWSSCVTGSTPRS